MTVSPDQIIIIYYYYENVEFTLAKNSSPVLIVTSNSTKLADWITIVYFTLVNNWWEIRLSSDISSAIILANSLVISKLDYFNSLLNRLLKSPINRLQVVQNSPARTIYPSAKRSDHISLVLHKLHWLPISSRIEFEITTLTFKVLKFHQPAYIYD